jgi:gliding motility-associated-like protein
MNHLRKLFIFIFLISLPLIVASQTAGKKLLIKPLQDKVFIQERGQFSKNARENKIPLTEPVLFGVENSEFSAYFTTHGIIFQFPERRNLEEKDIEKKDNETEERTVETTWHTANMRWVNANPSIEVTAEEKVANYYNYGGFEDNTSYNFVPAYKKIKYINVFPGVDAEFELPDAGGIKYRFLIQPNVAVPRIAFGWDGLEKINSDEKGNLDLKNIFSPLSLNSEWQLVDQAPNAFTTSSHTNIPVKYGVKGNEIEIQFLSSTISSPEGIVIDPWVTNTSYPSLNRAFDIQEDSVGNIFVHGNHTNYHIEKYNSAGVLQWSYVTYSVFLGDIAVDKPGNVYIIGGYCTGKRQKLDSSGVQVWAFPGWCEEWRLAFNYSKTVLAICGYYYNPPFNNVNIAQLNLNSGAISNEIAYSEETRAIATDCNGDMYSLHLPTSTLRKTNANFTPAGVVPSGLNLIYAGTGYASNPVYSSSVFQGFNGILISGPYVYIYDGITLRRFNKSNLTAINTVTVPNGVNYQCSGLATDPCGNVYAGTTNSIVEFDSALTYIAAIPTPGPVYDIILGSSGDLLACGEGFLGNFNITCSTPLPLVVTVTSSNAACNGGSSNIIATGGIAPYSYLWLPGGQTTDTLNHLTVGTYKCMITDPFCHSTSDSVTITQIPPLILSPGLVNVISPGVISNESCPNNFNGSATVIANGGTGPYYYFWNTIPVQHSQTAIGLQAGIYLATVVDADSCRDTVSIVITRHPSPVANFGSTKVCDGNATQFTDTSTTASGNINSWNWNFGDGTLPVNNIQNPSHLYAAAGNYSATLIVNNNFGCADTTTKAVKVYFNPIAGFTYNDVCFGDTVHFINTSTVDPSTSIASYLWVFADNNSSSSLQNPKRFYSSAGIYPVTLIVKTNDSCTNAITFSVHVYDAPKSIFASVSTCLLDSELIVNSSVSPVMGSIASYSWDLGDGSPLNTTVWNPHHLYPTPGTYVIKLITTSSNLGCADTVQHTITIFPMPVAKFSFTDVCLNKVMNFYDSSIVASGSITSWNWNFGDGTSLNVNQNPTHTYLNAGTYTVSLIVTTNNGCKDTVAKSVVVHPNPTALFSTHSVCLGDTSVFTDFSTIPANPTNDIIQFWTWSFGDGSTVFNNPNSFHLYSNAGSDSVKLSVVSNFGCSNSITTISVVNPNPVVNFIANDTVGCEPLCVSFQNTSSILTGNNVQWLWTFGDGSTTANSQNSRHCYSNDSVFVPNIFNVRLTVTSDSGCVSTKTKNNYITVYPLPVAGFTVQPQTTTITDPVVSVTNISTGSNFWNWNFGNNDTTSLRNPPSHTYADTGSYTITLITSTQYNCADTSHQTVFIEPDFLFYIPNAFTPNDDDVNDTFTGKGIFINAFEMSIFDRWGNLIFISDDINKGWDGKVNHGNEIAKQDVYVYVINVTDFKNKKHNYKGIVTLVK